MINMIGFKNDLIEVLEFHGKNKNRQILWKCLCKCGKEIIRTTWEIKTSRPKSCGCYIQARYGNKSNHKYHTKHGFANKHPLYSTWKNIKQRCYNPNNQDYTCYGAKGIAVCKEWKDDSAAFIKWGLHNNWQKGLVIDRIDFTNGYSPDNCQFITMSENSKKVFLDNPVHLRGVNHKDASISEDTVIKIKKLLAAGIKQMVIVRELNVSRNIVWQLAHNKTWKHIKI